MDALWKMREERDTLAAERDRLREELLGALRERDNARHGRNETDQWADVLREQLHEAEAERATLATQLARAEPVIEAALRWRWTFDDEGPSRAEIYGLYDAVIAYQSAVLEEATPATTEREGAGDE